MKIIVGSEALSYWGISRKEPLDLDYWTDEEFVKVPGEDWSTMPTEILELVEHCDGYATSNSLYTIKCSHFGWDIKWSKTKSDILWLKSKGCVLLPDLYEALLSHWKTVHNNKDYLSLGKSKKEFFTDHVKYEHDHDYLHELVAYPGKPMYTRVLKDNQEVLIDKNKFNNLPFYDKIRMFREEIAVIAIERWLVNIYWKGKISWYEAYMLSLKKTITTLTKNWATDFIVLNLEEFTQPRYSYFEHSIKTLKIEGYDIMEGQQIVDEILEIIQLEELGDYYDENFVLSEVLTENYQEVPGFKHITQDGGGEGGTEYCYSIFSWKDVTYKMEYSYYSYHGCDFDGAIDTIREVRPAEETITVWK